VTRAASPLVSSRPNHPNVRWNVDSGQVAREAETCDLLCLDLPKAEELRHGLPDAAMLDRWSRSAKALADPTRLAVALALARTDSACVCDLAWVVGQQDKLVSHHLRLLKAVDVVRSRREGKMVMYELTDHGRALLTGVIEAQRART
jgi:DNA-binding transcriptional ArsR family regulator